VSVSVLALYMPTAIHMPEKLDKDFISSSLNTVMLELVQEAPICSTNPIGAGQQIYHKQVAPSEALALFPLPRPPRVSS
jgi:hypothetical protein